MKTLPVGTTLQWVSRDTGDEVEECETVDVRVGYLDNDTLPYHLSQVTDFNLSGPKFRIETYPMEYDYDWTF